MDPPLGRRFRRNCLERRSLFVPHGECALKTRILVVDDSRLIRRLICEMLSEDSELEVIGEASSGLTAIQRAAALQPDVICLDIQMPHLNGFEAAQVIREVSPISKIIFVSAESGEDSMERAYECGASAFVLKDLLADELLPAIKMVQLDASPRTVIRSTAAECGTC